MNVSQGWIYFNTFKYYAFIFTKNSIEKNDTHDYAWKNDALIMLDRSPTHKNK